MSKEKVIINNVDDCIDRFYDEKLDIQIGMSLLFPKYKGKITQGRYITSKMASCFHPDAGGYVYAFNYRNSNFLENEVSKESYADYTQKWNLDKIGMSYNPKTRQNKSDKDLPYPDLKYNYTMALFPVKRYGGAKALEEAILSSLNEYNEQGEWFISCYGVWGKLLRWHIACFINGYL